MGMTVEQLAAARGRTVPEVLAACQATNVLAWSGHTPLDETEVAKVDAALAGGGGGGVGVGWGAPPPPDPSTAVGGPPPPPTTGFAAPPPPGGWAVPPQPFRPLQPSTPRRGSGIARVVSVVVAIAVSIGVRIGVRELFGANDDRPRFDPVDSALDFPADPSDGSDLVDMFVGQCFLDQSDPSAASDETVDADTSVVPCTDLHDGEVFHRTTLPNPVDEAYPGDDAAFQAAAALCFPQFETFVGLPYEQSTLDFVVFYPSGRSWVALDDRTVICAVTTLDRSQTTGSFLGAGI